MSELKSAQTDKKFLSIVDGSLREKVQEGTPSAVRREWEAGGEKGVKWELGYKEITGKITKVSFFEGESGGRKFQSLNIELDKIGNQTPVISTGVSTKYAGDLMKKLPSVDFSQEVRIRPFSFTPEGEDKVVTGVEILQKFPDSDEFGKKVTSFFHTKNAAGKWEAMNGFPVPDGDVQLYTSDDWKIFYLQVQRFLTNHIKSKIVPQFDGGQVAAAPSYSDDDFAVDVTEPA